jgi:hypothetical protein
MVMRISDLRKLSKRELWNLYDQKTEHVTDSLNYYQEEIKRREQSKQTSLLVILTFLVLVATVFAAIGAFIK